MDSSRRSNYVGRVAAREQPCPQCGATKGNPCNGVHGPRVAVHVERLAAAREALHAERSRQADERRRPLEISGGRLHIAARLRAFAAALEDDQTAEVEGEITLTRQRMPSLAEVEKWAANSEVWPEPEPQPVTVTLRFVNDLAVRSVA